MRWLCLPVKAVAWPIQRLPWVWRSALGTVLGLLWFDVLRIRRRTVIDNIRIAWPAFTRAEAVRLGRRAMVNFSRELVDYSRFSLLPHDRFEDFDFVGLPHLERAQARGKGVLLLTLHMGCGDLAVAAMAKRGIPVHLISKRFRSKWLDEAWFGAREQAGVKFIAPRNSSFGILRALKQNQVVIFVLDQYMHPPAGIRTTFFGRNTLTSAGLAALAQRSGAPVVPLHALRRDDGQPAVLIDAEIPFVAAPDPDHSVAVMTQRYTDQLEQYVRQYPDQWMWLHRRWK